MPNGAIAATVESPFPFGSLRDKTEKKSEIALTKVSVSGEIQGLLFTSEIKQEYVNKTNRNLELIYTFPMGWNTTLLGLEVTLDEKHFLAQVSEKKEAEETYEEAVLKGDTAILVERSAKGLYTANLGNIAPKAKVSLCLRCARLLNFDKNQIRLAIPVVIGERYGDPVAQGGLPTHASWQVEPEAEYAFALSIIVRGEMSKRKITCPSHEIVSSKEDEAVKISLKQGAVLDRDFVLLFSGGNNASSAQLLRHGEEHLVVSSFAIDLKDEFVSPVALKILIDCSGSMGGERIEQASCGLQQVFQSLAEHDYVSLSRFGSRVLRLNEKMLPCSEEVRAQFTEQLLDLSADLGGTEMDAALADTFALKGPKDFACMVLLITDGDVWNVGSIVQNAKKSRQRVFAIGVGSAPAESLLLELAEQTGGACEFVTKNESMAAAVLRMFERMRGKNVNKLRVDWHCKPLWQSSLPPYLYDGETLHCFALTNEVPTQVPTLYLQAGAVEMVMQADHYEVTDNSDLFRLGMQRRLEETSKKKQRLQLALDYQLVSEETSLILVCEREDGQKFQSLPKVQKIPQMVAHGHGVFAASVMAMAPTYEDRCPCYAPQPMSGGRRRSRKSLLAVEDICPNDICQDEEDSGMAKEQAQVSQAEPKLEDLLEAILKYFDQHALKAENLESVVNLTKSDPKYELFWDFMMQLHRELQLSHAVLWAIFLLWAEERCKALSFTRHAKRLLKAELVEIKPGAIKLVKSRFDASF
ncbi:MAG: VWA domain-containing protein [Desulfovibrio sp.]|nr:VWA domain-containing protein [Desulfovibrio sp.]